MLKRFYIARKYCFSAIAVLENWIFKFKCKRKIFVLTCKNIPNTSTCSIISVCPENMCAMYCEHGFEVDVNGCDICKCKNPRKYIV
jgi:hypothetical protein